MRIKTFSFVLFLLIKCSLLFSQVAINADGSNPVNSAMLDVKSNRKGFLPPRMTRAEMNAIPNPANGLIVYCTDCAPKGLGSLAIYLDGKWVRIISNFMEPILTTSPISVLTASVVSTGGNITSDNGASVIARGVCWGTTQNPTIANNKTTDGTGTGQYTSLVTGLLPGTTYFIRAYATNSTGTSYGAQLSLATTDVPKLTTNTLSGLVATMAIGGGNISSNGGTAVTERGVCWGLTGNPTVTDSKTTDGFGTGNFTSKIRNLITGTTYYMRAYATNSAGTAYGNTIIFTTPAPYNPVALNNAITEKMSTYNVPGLSIAVVKDEKLVYVHSYGYADIWSRRIAEDDDLYRIASLSKPITAIAILKLAEEGLITLDRKVFGTYGILGNDYGAPPANSKKDLITIKNLLDHKSGWTNSYEDIMFIDNSYTQSQLITFMLANHPLRYKPDSVYYYLNFGYCVLGRVIEKVTGVEYQKYMKSMVLSPCGITDMEIGGSRLQDIYPHEVRYFQPEEYPYNMNIPRMDSHGGWIATSTDLARFIVRIDRNNSKPDLISAASLSQMYFREKTWTHFGSLPGTSSILCRLNENISFAVLLNTRTEANPDLILNDLYSTITKEIEAITNWPTFDMF
jgi:CubicO group peptidase (beta-lactamase class C family)